MVAVESLQSPSAVVMGDEQPQRQATAKQAAKTSNKDAGLLFAVSEDAHAKSPLTTGVE
jgi:hypothetical protein